MILCLISFMCMERPASSKTIYMRERINIDQKNITVSIVANVSDNPTRKYTCAASSHVRFGFSAISLGGSLQMGKTYVLSSSVTFFFDFSGTLKIITCKIYLSAYSHSCFNK